MLKPEFRLTSKAGTLNHYPLSFGKPVDLHTTYWNTQQKNPRNWRNTATAHAFRGFKGWRNTQRKNTLLNLAKGGQVPTTWQGLMSENVNPITCGSTAANPPAGLIGCTSDGRQLGRVASEFSISSLPRMHPVTNPLLKAGSNSHSFFFFSRHFQANWLETRS